MQTIKYSIKIEEDPYMTTNQSPEAKLLAQVRRNRDIKALGIKLRLGGNCQVGTVAYATLGDRTEMFRVNRSYEEMIEVIKSVFK